MAVPDYKINYKSDFVLTINGDAGWAVPFCIKFWTGMPSQAYFVGFDGVKYVNCRVGDTPTQLLVMFDDHHLPIGKLKMQIAYHTTIEEFPGSVFDEVTNARDVIVTIDGTDYQVLLDFTGEDAPELEFDLPAYANEAERIQNELQRQQNEADRIAAELQREQATAAAVQGAENVDAQLNGTTLTVTNRNGVSTSVNTKGEQGVPGPVGPEGPQGEQGVSITGLVKTGETETATLYNVTFSDGTTQAVAIPKGEKGDTGATGPTGPQGPQGQTGVSITGLVKTGETETDTLYNVTFSDGTTQQVAIPKGEKGDKGDTGNTGATGATGATGPRGPQGERGLPGESGVTGDVSAFTVRQTIDPSATYGPTDIAGAATVQATNQELTELSEVISPNPEFVFADMARSYPKNRNTYVTTRYRCGVATPNIPIAVKVSGIPSGFSAEICGYKTKDDAFNAQVSAVQYASWGSAEMTFTNNTITFVALNVRKGTGSSTISSADLTSFSTITIELVTGSDISVDEIPTAESRNLVRSEGIYNALAEIKGGVIIYDDSLWTIWGYYINTSGVLTSYSGWAVSNPILLKKGWTVEVNTQGTNVAVIALTDSSGSSYTQLVNSGSASGNNKFTYTSVSDNDIYVALSGKVGLGDVTASLTIPSQFDVLSNDIDTINTALYGSTAITTKGLSDADVAYYKRGGETSTLTQAIRLRLIYPVPANATFSARCTLYSGIGVQLYATRSQAVVADTDYIENYSSYTTSIIQGTTSQAGYLTISWKNSSGGNLTQSDYDAFMANVQVSVSFYESVDPANSIEGRITALEDASLGSENSNIALLPIPSVVQGCYEQGSPGTQEGGVGDTTRTDLCTTNSLMLLPYNGVTLHAVLPDGIGCWFKLHNGPKILNSSSIFCVNGTTINCASQFNAYMIAFCYAANGSATGAAISPADVNALINSGAIKFWYEEKEGNVIQRTTTEDTYIMAVTQLWYPNQEGIFGRHNDDPVFLHISDIHGDGVRLNNALQWGEYKGVDAVINTGDNVFLSEHSGQGFIADIGSKYNVSQVVVVGNHEAYSSKDNSYRANSNTALYNTLIKPFENSYTMPSSSDYDDAPTYYYKDYPSINIRVIVVNQYEQGAYNAYANGRISQKQINWLIATLQSTPANYGVLLSYHANFTDVNKPADYSSFFEDMYDNAPRESSLAGITTQPITRIIDAFIAGSSASFTYTNLLIGSTTETVSVNADFSSINSGVEFIAHLFGHTHQDTIGYYAGTTKKQLALGVNASAALFETTNNTDLANTQDMARDGKGINQDCFNVYCIDRRNHLVRVAKVGCNMTIELNKRDYMSIPYAD